MPNQWFKFYGMEYLSDPKIMGMSAAQRSCWTTILSYASLSDGIIEYLSEQKMMLQAGVDSQSDEWDKTVGVYKHFEKLKMIEIQDDKITVINWKKRQEAYLTNAERQARFRDKKKQVSNAEVTPMLRNSNARIEENRIEKKRTNVAADKPRNAPRVTKKKKNEDADFEKWWNIYPNKVGKDKALKAWQRINPDLELKRKMAGAVLNHIKSDRWIKDDGGFIPHPTTWLNQRRWEEVLPKFKEKEKTPHYKGDKIVYRFGKPHVIGKSGEWLELGPGTENEIEML